MSGPTPGSRCSVCNHRQLAPIEDLLRARPRRSFAALAKQFDLGEKAISRHADNHMVFQDAPRDPRMPRVGVSAPNEPLTQPGADAAATADPADVLGRQLAYLDGLTMDGLSPAQRVDVLEARRRTADSLSRMVTTEVPSVVTVNQVEGLGELFATMHEALKQHPGAREALAKAWQEARAIPEGATR